MIDQRPNPRQIWNRIPPQVKQQVVDLALQHPDRSPRQIAWLFTDKEGYFISEARFQQQLPPRSRMSVSIIFGSHRR